MSNPWLCPRCKCVNSPDALKCDCKPREYVYCPECLKYAMELFPVLPDDEVLYAFAQSFHFNFVHRNGECQKKN